MYAYDIAVYAIIITNDDRIKLENKLDDLLFWVDI